MNNSALLIDYEYCTGCHACEVACKKYLDLPKGQYGIRVFQDGPRQLPDGSWEYNYLPMPTSLCDLCAGRIEEGKDPTCVHHCPAHCMHYGSIDELADRLVTPHQALYVPVIRED